MRFIEFAARPWTEVLNGVSDVAIDLVSHLVRYESNTRLRADAVKFPTAVVLSENKTYFPSQVLEHPLLRKQIYQSGSSQFIRDEIQHEHYDRFSS